MTRFTQDNTDGYDAADLKALNAAWDSLPISVADDTDIAVKSLQDHISEELLASYDRGLRGEMLLAFYYDAEG